MDPVTEALARVGTILELPGLAIQAVARGPQVRIEIARGQGWSGQMAEDELRRLHVPICGRGFTDKTLYLYVRERQAAWAEYVLRRAGAPVLSVVDPHNVAWAEGKGRIPSWDERRRPVVGRGRTGPRAVVIRREPKQRGLLARLVDWLAGGER